MLESRPINQGCAENHPVQQKLSHSNTNWAAISLITLSLFGCEKNTTPPLKPSNERSYVKVTSNVYEDRVNDILKRLYPAPENEIERFQNAGWQKEDARSLGVAMSCIRETLPHSDPRRERLATILITQRSFPGTTLAAYSPVTDDIGVSPNPGKSLVRAIYILEHEGLHSCAHREVAKDVKQENAREFLTYTQNEKDLKALKTALLARLSEIEERDLISKRIDLELYDAETLRKHYQSRIDLCSVLPVVDGLHSALLEKNRFQNGERLKEIDDAIVKSLKRDPALSMDAMSLIKLLEEMRSMIDPSSFRLQGENGEDITNKKFDEWIQHLVEVNEIDMRPAPAFP